MQTTKTQILVSLKKKKKRTQILENKNAMPKIEMMEKKNEWTVGVLKDRINK